jgi:hypothetical protein
VFDGIRLVVEVGLPETKELPSTKRNHSSTSADMSAEDFTPVVAALSAHGRVNDATVEAFVRQCRMAAPADQVPTVDRIAEEVAAVDSSGAKNPIAVVRKLVPQYFGSRAYKMGLKPVDPKDKVNERDRRALEAASMHLESMKRSKK